MRDIEQGARTGVVSRLRVSAYAVCVRDDEVLLARWVNGDQRQWTLPGGGIELAEDPYDAALREATEETGYTIGIDHLLGVDTECFEHQHDTGVEVNHCVRIIYSAHVAGGELRHEIDGSTDRAAWIRLDEVNTLDRVRLVDVGLRLHRTRPAHGRLQ